MRRPALLAAAFALAPLAARAGEAACWFEGGVLVVPAEVAGVAADYVLDTGAPQTLLADSQAQAAGYGEPQISGGVQLAGVTVPVQPITVAKLDGRFWRLPTPAAGVIGADALRGLVLDVSFQPCRVGLWRPPDAPAFRVDQVLPLTMQAGRPTVPARVADDARALSGGFIPATGSDTAVRVRDDLADAPGAAKREALYPYGALRPKLRALSFAGALFENLPAGLIKPDEISAEGEIGAPVLSGYSLRFDFAGGQLLLAHEKGPPDRSGGP